MPAQQPQHCLSMLVGGAGCRIRLMEYLDFVDIDSFADIGRIGARIRIFREVRFDFTSREDITPPKRRHPTRRKKVVADFEGVFMIERMPWLRMTVGKTDPAPGRGWLHEFLSRLFGVARIELRVIGWPPFHDDLPIVVRARAAVVLFRLQS